MSDCKSKITFSTRKRSYCKQPIIERKLSYFEAFPIKQSDLKRMFGKS